MCENTVRAYLISVVQMKNNRLFDNHHFPCLCSYGSRHVESVPPVTDPGRNHLSMPMHSNETPKLGGVIATLSIFVTSSIFRKVDVYLHNAVWLFLTKFCLRLTQSAFLLSLSLHFSFSSLSHFLLSPSRKTFLEYAGTDLARV